MFVDSRSEYIAVAFVFRNWRHFRQHPATWANEKAVRRAVTRTPRDADSLRMRKVTFLSFTAEIWIHLDFSERLRKMHVLCNIRDHRRSLILVHIKSAYATSGLVKITIWIQYAASLQVLRWQQPPYHHLGRNFEMFPRTRSTMLPFHPSKKKNPASAKGNARQRCMCEGPVRTKSKFTTMFHLDSMADDA